MKITLNPEQEKLIEAQVTSGRYPSAEEVIAAALALLADSRGIKNKFNITLFF